MTVNVSVFFNKLHGKTQTALIKQYPQYYTSGRFILPAHLTLKDALQDELLGNLYLLACHSLAHQKTSMENDRKQIINFPQVIKRYQADSVGIKLDNYSGDILLTFHTSQKQLYIIGDCAGHGIEVAGYAYLARVVIRTLVQENPEAPAQELIQK